MLNPSKGAPLVLQQRLGPKSPDARSESGGQGWLPLRLPLTAHERTSLRGHRRSSCGRELLLQLPRGAPLAPGEALAPAEAGPQVIVEAAAEPVVVVRSDDPLSLLRAAYHLGNRHVALQLRAGELRLLQDPVLEDMLRHRGLSLERLDAPFLPEPGAYASGEHPHR